PYFDRTTRIYEGTVLLNMEPGLTGAAGSFSHAMIGSDVAGAPAATLRLAGSDQIRDDRNVYVLSSGLFALNGQSDRIAALQTVVGPAGAGDVNIGAGGLLTLNGNVDVFSVGTGNPAGSTVTGGTLALQVFGTIAAAGTRTFTVN